MTIDDLNEAIAHAKAAAFYCKAAGGPFSQLETVNTDSIYTSYKLCGRKEEAKRATTKFFGSNSNSGAKS
jgi:hypothetical protein